MATAKKAAPKSASLKTGATPKKGTAAKKPSVKTTAKKKAPAKKTAEGKVVFTAAQVDAALTKIANGIVKEFPTTRGLVLLGIRTRGVFLADRLKELLEKKYKQTIASGVLDITFYRDDLTRLGPQPKVRGSELPHDIHDANILLVDDVLYTGRTVRAALDEISDFGRPATIRLVVLVDRGLREYPIQPDYCGLTLKTTDKEIVHVKLTEADDEDSVVLAPR